MIRCKHYLHAYVAGLLRTLTLVGVLPLVLLPDMTQAQVTTNITSDGSLGTQVTPNGKIHEITSGTRSGGGPNLFHSFGQFSVGAGDIASFNGPSGIENILSRVTGGDPSNIFGTIRSTVDGANLFFMNPAGVLFGPEASLEISGSFHTTTADFLRLGEAGIFYADLNETSALTVAPPQAFGFLGTNPAGITIDQSLLAVPDGETLSIVSGDARIVGNGSFPPDQTTPTLTAPSGRLNIASVASAGEVILNAPGEFPVLEVDSFESFGSVLLENKMLLNVSGNRGGTVTIRGGQLTVENSFVFADTEGDLNGASLGIDIEVAGDVTVNDGLITADVIGTGDGGDIRVSAANLQLIDVPPDAFDGAFPTISQAKIGSRGIPPGGMGNTGDVSVTTGDLRIEGRAEITTSTGEGLGKGGNISVSADNVSILGTSNPDDSTGIFANTFGSDPGGRIQIIADNLALVNGGSIESGTTASGDSGGVTVDLMGNLDLREGSFILGDSDGIGKAADINLSAQDINITGIRDATDPGDRAQGTFTGIDSSAESAGQGGNVNIMAENLQVTDNGTISTSSTDIGSNAGNIDIKVSDSILIENSNVTTEAKQADGGNITLMAPDTIRLINSQLTTSVDGGRQTEGGNINIDPRFVILENSRIVANAFQGQGGDINITTETLLANPASVIDASSEFGISGNVEINSPDTNIIEGTLELPESFLNVQSLLSTRCASRTTKPASSFFVTNGGLPLGPDTLIPAGVTGVGINSGESDGPQSDHSNGIPELLVQTSAFGGCTYEKM